ncbi:alanine/glycine:cation symporter family protein [Miniphocaeibacter massiliensis]|uniref:alanine/glycine:cation symporter family protein n=1 Tax=Miniphocaeibacter massiliensis TaxID=2041841 RepID=UPI000C1B96B8|nr:alanine/glycine:cation symporter family protein [Miniphocaeibacter massiliensis]
MNIIENIVSVINSITRDKILLAILPLTGIFFTLYLGFPQIRRLPSAFKQTFGGLFDKEENKRRKAAGEVTSFQALSVAVAAQVGTGNIVGVATAIVLGGPGAVFWMWMAAFLGMGTIFAEAILAQKYRERDSEGELIGGPAYYIKNGIKNKTLGKILATTFSVLIIIALGLIGNMVQANSIAATVGSSIAVDPIWVGIIVMVLAGMVFLGGIGRIASFAEKIVPVMAIFYISLAIYAMFAYSSEVVPVLKTIFREAFSTGALIGGGAGIAIQKAMTFGVSRGLFSNEAGMGSTPHAHATAKVNHPLEQGLTAIIGVFISTFLICTATAVVILVTEANFLDKPVALITQEAFYTVFGNFGKHALTICISCFSFTTIVGWYYFGESNIKFLFGEKLLTPYRLVVLSFVFIGAIAKVDLVWELADMFNSLMVIPNLIAIVMLAKQVKGITRDYDRCKKLGKITYDYEYDKVVMKPEIDLEVATDKI